MVGMALSITSGTMRRLLCKGLFFKILDPGRERTNRMKLSSFGRMPAFLAADLPTANRVCGRQGNQASAPNAFLATC